MKRILRIYSILATACICAVILLVGIITAENNTRKLSFGEEYETVQIYNTNSEKIGISAGDNSIEVPSDILQKSKDIIKIFKPVFSPVINNFNWFTDNIKELFE
ncbi:MAG: hypothetical protein EOM05_07710 [Clostridia bacterium]|nr:hypothetical protein [Clostridia bacterium]